MNPKTYFAYANDTDEHKRSSKGIQHRTKIDYKTYYDVLYNDAQHEVINNIMKFARGEMASYDQKKIGVTDIHTKNYVLEDRVSTRPFPENM